MWRHSPRHSLVEGPGENQVLSLCSYTPVSTWHCAAIPCRYTTTDLRHVCTLSSSVCRNGDSGRPFDPSFNTRRPSVSCDCCTRLELSAVFAASSPVTDDVQAPLESRTVRVLLHLGLTLSSPNCLTALSTRVFFSLILYSALATAIAVSRHSNHAPV